MCPGSCPCRCLEGWPSAEGRPSADASYLRCHTGLHPTECHSWLCRYSLLRGCLVLCQSFCHSLQMQMLASCCSIACRIWLLLVADESEAASISTVCEHFAGGNAGFQLLLVLSAHMRLWKESALTPRLTCWIPVPGGSPLGLGFGATRERICAEMT